MPLRGEVLQPAQIYVLSEKQIQEIEFLVLQLGKLDQNLCVQSWHHFFPKYVDLSRNGAQIQLT